MQQLEQIEFMTPQRVFIFDPDASASLELIQIGLDALAELPPAVQAQFAWGEQYLRRRKAVLEAKYIP